MKISDTVKIVTACAPDILTGVAGDGAFIDLRPTNHATVKLTIKNGTGTVASNVSLLQANVTGQNSKVLSFDTYYKNEDTGAGDLLTKATTSNNSFLTANTASKALQYVIDIPYSNLDSANGFCTVRVDVANMANAVGSVDYILKTNYQPLNCSVKV